MIQQLETVLARVIDWLKYEEAKNGARVTLDGRRMRNLWSSHMRVRSSRIQKPPSSNCAYSGLAYT